MAGDIVLCSWLRHFSLTVPHSSQLYKWVAANLTLGVNQPSCNGLASHPGGSRNTPSHFMLLQPEINAGLILFEDFILHE